MKIEKVKNFNNINLDFIKKHLRIDDDFIDDDSYIQILIKTATKTAENYINGDIADTTATILEKDFCGSYYEIFDPNIREIVGISGNTTSITAYDVDKFEDYWMITFDNSVSDVDLNIVYKSGFEEGNIDEAIQHAIAVKVSELYDVDKQGYVSNAIKETNLFTKLLNPYKRLV